MKIIYFTHKKPEEILNLNKPLIFNFFNLHNIFWYFKNQKYREILSKQQNINFPDGKQISKKLKIKQQRGPYFTKRFLFSDLAKNKKHFFIGLDLKDIEKLVNITNIKKSRIGFYNPPFIKDVEFSVNERKKIIKLVNSFQPDFIWICIGSPKQDILANQLFEKYPLIYFNIGAGMDFLLEKKKEAPKIFTLFGIEWLYRLITDFKNSKKKVWRSFIALNYLNKIYKK